MIDFKLTEDGDIDLASAYQYPSFTINFYVPSGDIKHNALRIDFDTDIPDYNTASYGLKIEFDTDLYSPRAGHINTVPVYGNEELAQQVAIRLKTELGEFPFITSLGSQLVLERHEDIRSSVTLEQVKEYVEAAIADVDFENDYTVTVERIDDPSRFRYETLKITIDTGGITAYGTTI